MRPSAPEQISLTSIPALLPQDLGEPASYACWRLQLAERKRGPRRTCSRARPPRAAKSRLARPPARSVSRLHFYLGPRDSGYPAARQHARLGLRDGGAGHARAQAVLGNLQPASQDDTLSGAARTHIHCVRAAIPRKAVGGFSSICPLGPWRAARVDGLARAGQAPGQTRASMLVSMQKTAHCAQRDERHTVTFALQIRAISSEGLALGAANDEWGQLEHAYVLAQRVCRGVPAGHAKARNFFK